MNDILVYSKPNCKNCKMLKRWLDIKKIDYSEVDITQNEDAYEKLVSTGRTSLPALEVKGDFVEYKEFNEILDMI